MGKKCQKKEFRVETTIKRCENYKPKGKQFKLITDQPKKQTHDRGTSPPPSPARHHIGTSPSRSPRRHETSTSTSHMTEGQKRTKKAFQSIAEKYEKMEQQKRKNAHYNPDDDDDDIAFDTGADRKKTQSKFKAQRAAKLLRKARRNVKAVHKLSLSKSKEAPPARSLTNRIRGFR